MSGYPFWHGERLRRNPYEERMMDELFRSSDMFAPRHRDRFLEPGRRSERLLDPDRRSERREYRSSPPPILTVRAPSEELRHSLPPQERRGTFSSFLRSSATPPPRASGRRIDRFSSLFGDLEQPSKLTHGSITRYCLLTFCNSATSHTSAYSTILLARPATHSLVTRPLLIARMEMVVLHVTRLFLAETCTTSNASEVVAIALSSRTTLAAKNQSVAVMTTTVAVLASRGVSRASRTTKGVVGTNATCIERDAAKETTRMTGIYRTSSRFEIGEDAETRTTAVSGMRGQPNEIDDCS